MVPQRATLYFKDVEQKMYVQESSTFFRELVGGEPVIEKGYTCEHQGIMWKCFDDSVRNHHQI